MNKLFAILLALTTISLTFAGRCGNSTRFCNEYDSCCPAQNVSDFRCCNGRNAACCADGISCCPGGTMCDLRNRRCIPRLTSLAFLSADNFSDEVQTISSGPTDAFKYPNVEALMKCIIEEATKMAPELEAVFSTIITDFKENKYLDVLVQLKKLSGDAKDLYKKCKSA